MSLRFLLAALAVSAVAGAQHPPVYGYKIVRQYPHDPAAFTQGLVFSAGYLYEGTGQHGQSWLRKVELETGKVLKESRLPESYFGEGIALWKDKIFQLTWQSKIGFVYELASFKQTGSFLYQTEGWGLTQDGRRLILSDGSSFLSFREPETFRETGRIQVTESGAPVPNLNELEYIRGEIWANVWQTDRVARIHPATGKVVSWVDFTGLRAEMERMGRVDVLNGIAYDGARDRIFVTGKWWPRIFEIKVIPR
jgi:glutamine cyclotransferase